MRFNILPGLVALLSLSTMAQPLLSASQPGRINADSALAIVQSLNSVLSTHSQNINNTMAGMSASSSADEKSAAANSVGPELQAMTVAVSNAVGQLGDKSNNVVQSRQNGGGDVQGLADALRTTLSMVAGTVNTLLAVLGLTPLLAFLTPLTGSLSGLVLSLKTVVDELLPILNTVLDGVVVGLSQALGGLIL